MRLVRHPFFERDLIGIVDHIVDVTDSNTAAAAKGLDEIDAMISTIAKNPISGVRLKGSLDGWLVRHGGSGRRLTIVFKPDVAAGVIDLALVAFGGRDWVKLASVRKQFSE
ncbi:MAG: type II toxin-antitoxin system RelE/ParE family toxin [Pseudomonadota bacterium]